jgi:hypothetical protein
MHEHMKGAIRLHFSTTDRVVRAVLLLVVMIVWAVVIRGMLPRGDKPPASGTERASPIQRFYNMRIAVPV